MTSLSTPLLDDTFPLPLSEPFTRQAALTAGLTDWQLHSLCNEGLLRRPIRGAYVAAQVPDSIRLRASLLKLVVPPGCFVTDRTAAWLHGASAALAPNDHLKAPLVSIFRPADAGRLRNGLSRSGERTLGPRDLVEVDGIVATTPLRTALDLGRLLHRDQAIAGLDAMLRLGTFSHDELLANIERFKKQRGVRQLRQLAPLADGGAESPGESALRLRWYDAGLPRPQLQIPILEDGYELFWLDMGLEELLFAAEYDGERWHSSSTDRENDRKRRSWLRSRRQWQIEVYLKHNVYGHRQDAVESLAGAYRRARASLGERSYILLN